MLTGQHLIAGELGAANPAFLFSAAPLPQGWTE
jgi:hypothetical protein